MTSTPLTVLVLAAGMGTRMKSQYPKVMHPVGGRPMIEHVIDLGCKVGADNFVVVIGPDMEAVAETAMNCCPQPQVFIQEERRGTAHAVLSARPALEGLDGTVLVLYADTPLLTQAALNGLLDELKADADVGVLGFEAQDPTGYGRLLVDESGALVAIREEKDASEAEQSVRFCNSGVMGFRAQNMLNLLDQIDDKNANGEFYLTDAIELARARGLRAVATLCSEQDVLGVNDRVQLSEAEAIFQARRREQVQRAGATLIAPETVFFSYDTVIGQDVVIEPHVVFGPNVTVRDGAHIYAFSHITGAEIGERALVGPYARLRPGAEIGVRAKIGNFVEVKGANIGEGAKVNHLSYIGDAEVGQGANIGAGTITCNYDGYFKHKTIIGQNCFVGSNSSLIAPLTLGDGSYVGSGSVLSQDVPDDALAITRPERRLFEGWAMRFRRSQSREKANKSGS